MNVSVYVDKIQDNPGSLIHSFTQAAVTRGIAKKGL
jgi:hypothetical protein